ncbi:O-succinylbenzoic acid--CoA ligase [Amycolatopsis bartoniae]|uniref:O-succinylbenzoic acid--CoA ligase n=1 Tax=Amycolatopsis bartoniae TaxID=941986 RepID=A0A8H9J169_9PSEU|nr:o-succinylbenzoate--CoA ligase [Amycolatopsis bartoniae]MBB2933672.1 O-succinylbenzoic acid--CoA ligase [Amycolatopsis bartoniae]TVT10833.1 AMP-binding protein [Amycolatopsis bartoniae]GHF72441.1 O-succinylbenzoic acid--CoA ligase [Amycolatopsis bartoniae]
MREVLVDGSVDELRKAVADALDGGTAVLPLAPGSTGLRDAMAPEQPVEPGTAVIIATSGSTGEPKGVLLSADALRASALATHQRLGGPGHWLLATPAQYIGGLQVIVRSLLAGTTCAALPPGHFDGELFASAAAAVLAEDGPRYTALVPTQLTRILDGGGRGLDAARAFDAIIIGAAATSAALRERALDAGVRIVPAYGMSETASGCVYDGVPLDGVEVRIGTDDRVLIAGPVLTHGYRLRPDLTAEALVDGWFRTGDRGRLVDGRLEVLGRLDDVINTGGVKVPAAAVERALGAVAGVREACVVGLPDAEWGQVVAAAVVAEEPVAEADLRAAVRAEVGAPAVPKRFAFVDALPLRGPGKVDRAAVVSHVFATLG